MGVGQRSERYPLSRRKVVCALVGERDDLLVVAGLGAPAWDVAAAGDRPSHFPMWGGMGGAVMVGLGLALAQPARRVMVITGDGEMLMGLGSLATAAVQRANNLAVVVLDNERYGETGMQETHTAFDVDLARIAAACGFSIAGSVRDENDLGPALQQLAHDRGPVFYDIKVRAEALPLVLPPKDGAYLKDRFRASLLGGEAIV